MNKSFFSHTCLFLVFLSFLFSGCAKLRPKTDPELDIAAKGIAAQAKSLNQQILTSKGVGWVTIKTADETTKYRMAWAVIFPNKIRLTFMLMGVPVETIIGTKKTITFFSHTGEHSKHVVEANDQTLESYIHVPVKMSEIIAILLGRLPIKHYDDAYFPLSDISRSIITLHQKRNGPTQQLFVDKDQKVNRIFSTDITGSPIYNYTINHSTSFDFGQIPSEIVIKDNKNQRLILTITRFVANPEVKETAFVLTEQG